MVSGVRLSDGSPKLPNVFTFGSFTYSLYTLPIPDRKAVSAVKNSQKGKINLFLGGLFEKYRQNPDYFVDFGFSVFSGTKEFKGKIKPAETGFTVSFAGDVLCKDEDEAADRVCALVIEYDRAIIFYEERGLRSEIEADDRNVKVSKKEIKQTPVKETNLKEKEYNISLHKAKDLLFELGYTTAEGKLRNDMIRKYNQTDRFIDLIGEMFDGREKLRIVDCACGKSYLSFVLNYWLWQEKRIRAEFTGIDISEQVIAESRKKAEHLGYSNMKFIQKDLSKIDDCELEAPDAVISLHACDTATDMAMGYGIRNGAKNIICVPCCHKELLEKYQSPTVEPLVKHGIFRARFNAILTDSLRVLKLEACGYKVSCVEYCSPLDTPKNLLIKAQKISDGNREAEQEYRRMLKEFNVFPAIEIYSNKAYCQ